MRQSRFKSLKPEILRLRKEGLSYSQINERLGVKIPQSTLSNWCSTVILSENARELLSRRMTRSAYRIAVVKEMAKQRRLQRREAVVEQNHHLAAVLDDRAAAKVALLMLYLGEGKKDEREAVVFANSNPGIISLFLRLFMQVYDADIKKFRITVQCRADQNVEDLERFWRGIIDIQGIRFYPTRIDKRTIGKPTNRKDYKGVCCIAYLDTRIQFELVNIGKFICSNPKGP